VITTPGRPTALSPIPESAGDAVLSRSPLSLPGSEPPAGELMRLVFAGTAPVVLSPQVVDAARSRLRLPTCNQGPCQDRRVSGGMPPSRRAGQWAPSAKHIGMPWPMPRFDSVMWGREDWIWTGQVSSIIGRTPVDDIISTVEGDR